MSEINLKKSFPNQPNDFLSGQSSDSFSSIANIHTSETDVSLVLPACTNFLYVLFLSSIFYMASVGIGLGMTYATVRNIYNMTTGHLLDHKNGTCNIHICTVCFNDKDIALYGGCFIVGALCNIILLLVSKIIYETCCDILKSFGFIEEDKRESISTSADKESLLTSSDFEAGEFNPNIDTREFDSDFE